MRSRDFTPIAMLGGTPNLLVVSRAVPVGTLQEFVAYAKANPGKVDYGTSGVGTLNHLVMEQFKHASGVPSMAVPYRSIGQAFTDAMGGQIQVIFPGLAAAMPHVRSGAFKPLAVTGDHAPSAAARRADVQGVRLRRVRRRSPGTASSGRRSCPRRSSSSSTMKSTRLLATQELRDTFAAQALDRDADDAGAVRQVHRRRDRALEAVARASKIEAE